MENSDFMQIIGFLLMGIGMLYFNSREVLSNAVTRSVIAFAFCMTLGSMLRIIGTCFEIIQLVKLYFPL